MSIDVAFNHDCGNPHLAMTAKTVWELWGQEIFPFAHPDFKFNFLLLCRF
jgi:hypothetical protein